MSARELEGQVALVTGGSRGIGRAIAEALAAAGARVAVVARDGARAEAAAAELPAPEGDGNGHAGFACDVADPAAAAETITAVEERLGPVDILVNNAGITRDNLLLRMKDEEFDEVIAVNLKGAFNFTRCVARGMMKRRRGAILNVTSVVGLLGNPGQANYAASKAGLVGLTKAVARELASRGVRCNAIAPGFITTDMTAALTEAQTAELRGRIPLGELGEPADVAAAARFLVGPGARYITGQVLAVDGGMAM
ncbi:MAG TPA: 3-oxoacyl-[acyl-carrier-protein] reductase [Longimicrobiales bacterium]|nr:3-oxoacyl-[acyl-carrier-protein] reductase [Longimicrobiales bacterium]